MIRARYRLCLSLQAPLLTHAAGTLSLGLDAATLRYRGQPVINGSLIRGNLRHLLERFARDLAQLPDPDDPHLRPVRAPDITDWFGPPQTADGDPRIAYLAFDFWWRFDPASAPTESAQPARHRTAIDPAGVVAPGQLQIAESGFAVGAEPAFTGEIRARFSDEAARRHCERWLGKALARLPAIGAQKGVGYGRVVRAELLRLEPVARVEPRIDTDALGTRIGLVLHLSQPFNIAQTAQFQPENNRYLNHDQIPGAAIKGVLAHAHGGVWEALQRDLALDDLVVTTALPAPRTNPRRSLPLPLSLAVFATPRGLVVHDLALEAVPGLLKHDSALVPPCFLPDWKDTHREHARRAWDPAAADAAPPEHLLVIRTAIRPEDQVAEESQLFALECTDVQDHCWCLDLDLRHVHPADPAARRAVTERLVALLSAGLEDLGKTRACARVEIRPQPFGSTECPQPIPIDGLDGWVILLRTPARLLPARLEALTMPIASTNGADALKAAYAAYWHSACPELELRHYYARQELVGGHYYWRHFRGREDYRPEWLTLAGSVFVLTSRPGADPAAIRTALTQWQHSGLPQADDRAADTWETNPYLRENGFAEIAVNDSRHLLLAPDAGVLHRLSGEAP